MKTITLDFDAYMEELEEHEECGKDNGICLVMKWLESGKTLEKFLNENRIYGPFATKDGDDGDVIDPLCHWARIEKAINKLVSERK